MTKDLIGPDMTQSSNCFIFMSVVSHLFSQHQSWGSSSLVQIKQPKDKWVRAKNNHNVKMTRADEEGVLGRLRSITWTLWNKTPTFTCMSHLSLCLCADQCIFLPFCFSYGWIPAHSEVRPQGRVSQGRPQEKKQFLFFVLLMHHKNFFFKFISQDQILDQKCNSESHCWVRSGSEVAVCCNCVGWLHVMCRWIVLRS